MNLSISITYWEIAMIAFSVACFGATTVFCRWQGLFDGPNNSGIGAAFVLLCYSLFWAIPTLIFVIVGALWLK